MDTEARAEGAIPVQVIADASLPSRYSYGAGFSTDVGPRVLAEWQRPLLNPQGHGAEASAEWSLIRQNLTAQYRLPWQHPLQDRLEFSIGIQQERIEDTDTLQTVVSAQRVLAPPRRWQKSWGVRLFEERFERDNGERAKAAVQRVQHRGLHELEREEVRRPCEGGRHVHGQHETAETAQPDETAPVAP